METNEVLNQNKYIKLITDPLKFYEIQISLVYIHPSA